MFLFENVYAGGIVETFPDPPPIPLTPPLKAAT